MTHICHLHVAIRMYMNFMNIYEYMNFVSHLYVDIYVSYMWHACGMNANSYVQGGPKKPDCI